MAGDAVSAGVQPPCDSRPCEPSREASLAPSCEESCADVEEQKSLIPKADAGSSQVCRVGFAVVICLWFALALAAAVIVHRRDASGHSDVAAPRQDMSLGTGSLRLDWTGALAGDERGAWLTRPDGEEELGKVEVEEVDDGDPSLKESGRQSDAGHRGSASQQSAGKPTPTRGVTPLSGSVAEALAGHGEYSREDDASAAAMVAAQKATTEEGEGTLDGSMTVVTSDASDCEGKSCHKGCHTASRGEACYVAAMWAMHTGIKKHPDWYPGLKQDSSFHEVQAVLFNRGYNDCPMPCSATSVEKHTMAQDEVEGEPTPAPATTPSPTPAPRPTPTPAPTPAPKPAPTPASTVAPTSTTPAAEDEECHTALPHEECYEHLVWAKHTGVNEHPEWYPDLDSSSSLGEFQAQLHQTGHGKCKVPCVD
mmetsp:Transcript_40754/g.86798  ORF Transcript_40754/g.86798 Transcript_40754/m.86798 type:complete len:423 (+) Transcript_40754:91-1359(+)